MKLSIQTHPVQVTRLFRRSSLNLALTIGLSIGVFNSCYARIKLITLPVREQVEIQLQNKDVTIIEEERIVPLQKGINEIDFAWKNTSIQADTIIFRILKDPQSSLQTNVLSVNYPDNEDALTWRVSANENGNARVRISYAIDSLDRSYHYIALADKDEQRLDLKQYVKVNNQSGESFEQANLRISNNKSLALPIGLDESQEFLSHQYTQIPIEKTYTVSASNFGYRNRAQEKLNVLMHYVLPNDKSHQLGQEALPAGKIRLYQKDDQASQVFLGEDWGKYTAKNDELRLYIGDARDIVVKRTIERQKKRRVNGNLYDIDVVVKYEIENFKDKAVDLIINESLYELRNQVFSSYKNQVEWQIGKDNSFQNPPIKKFTNSKNIAYQVSLPARTKDKTLKIIKKLNINFKNQW